MTRPYCPACLDVWSIQPSRITLRDFTNVGHGVRMHVTCGRALEAIRTAPATFEFEPVQRSRWAA